MLLRFAEVNFRQRDTSVITTSTGMDHSPEYDSEKHAEPHMKTATQQFQVHLQHFAITQILMYSVQMSKRQPSHEPEIIPLVSSSEACDASTEDQNINHRSILFIIFFYYVLI